MAGRSVSNVPPSLPPAGWYVDPEYAGYQRYWDGHGWTSERRGTVAPAGPPPPPPSAAPMRRQRRRRTPAVAIALLAIAAIALWSQGTFDKLLVNVGLNATDCYETAFGSTVCGKQAEALKRLRDDLSDNSKDLDRELNPPTRTQRGVIGQALTLTADRSSLEIRPRSVEDPFQSGDEFDKPDKGRRYVAVEFEVTNTGTEPYSDGVDPELFTADGRKADTAILGSNACEGDLGTIPPGETQRVCVPYDVAHDAGLDKIQVEMTAFEGGDALGIWSLR
jgi:hypothetical protein